MRPLNHVRVTRRESRPTTEGHLMTTTMEVRVTELVKDLPTMVVPEDLPRLLRVAAMEATPATAEATPATAEATPATAEAPDATTE